MVLYENDNYENELTHKVFKLDTIKIESFRNRCTIIASDINGMLQINDLNNSGGIYVKVIYLIKEVKYMLNQIEVLSLDYNINNNCYIALENESIVGYSSLKELSLLRLMDLLNNIADVISFNITRNGNYEIIEALKAFTSTEGNLKELYNRVWIRSDSICALEIYKCLYTGEKYLRL